MRRLLPALALLAVSCDAAGPPSEAEQLARQFAALERTIEATDARLGEDLERLVSLEIELDHARKRGDGQRIEALEPVVSRWQALVKEATERLSADRARLLELEVRIRELESEMQHAAL